MTATDLCALLDCRVPILSAPTGGAAGPELLAAVCDAGGYGAIPLWGGTPDAVARGIDAVRERTDRPFAVNLNLSFDTPDHLSVCIDKGVHGVSLFWGEEAAWIGRARAAGLRTLVTVGTAAEAKRAEEAGAHIVVAQGWEAGGHVWGQVAGLALIPAVADAVGIPVVAAGGIADGRGLAAALVLGASGAWIGTRFLAAKEAVIHEDYRRALLAASAEDAEWYADLYDLAWPDAPHRALANDTARIWREAGRPALEDRPEKEGEVGRKPDGSPVRRYESYTPKTGTTGDIAAMSLWSGQGVGLVRKVQPAAEIVAEIERDARAILGSTRLP